MGGSWSATNFEDEYSLSIDKTAKYIGLISDEISKISHTDDFHRTIRQSVEMIEERWLDLTEEECHLLEEGNTEIIQYLVDEVKNDLGDSFEFVSCSNFWKMKFINSSWEVNIYGPIFKFEKEEHKLFYNEMYKVFRLTSSLF